MRATSMGWAGAMTSTYEASQKFFSESLGLTVAHVAQKSVLTHFRLPSGQLLELYGPSDTRREHPKFRYFDGHALGFEVDDLTSARQEMIEQGVHFIHEIERWQEDAWAMFLGPEELLLQIETPSAAPESPDKNAILQQFSWAGVVMQDFDGAVRFFSEVMQLPLAHLEEARPSAQFQLPHGHLFEILGPDHVWSEMLHHLTLGFQVANVPLAREILQERGVQFISPLERTAAGHQFTFFRDLDNYRYALWQPRPRPIIAGGKDEDIGKDGRDRHLSKSR